MRNSSDRSWQDALSQAGLGGTPQVGRTPIEGIRELRRRERVAELRALHRGKARRHWYAKMLLAAVLVNVALAWTLMITVGVLHASWWHVVPTMGYHTASLVTGLGFLGVVVTIMIIQAAGDSS